MGKNEMYNRGPARGKKNAEPHPIWRALGCLTSVIILVISIALSMATVNYVTSARWFLPAGLFGTPQFPDLVWKVPQFAAIARPLADVDNLYALILISALYALILAGISSMLYAFAYRVMGPPRYGPNDVPPPKGVKVKPYKR